MARSSVWGVVVGLLWTAALPNPAAGETLTVGEGGDATTVGAALDAARPGDTILVGPGEYRENLVIDKRLVVLGQNQPHIRGGGRGDVIRLTGDDVVLNGFTVSGSGNSMIVSDAGVKISGKRVRVEDNVIVDNLFGIYLRGAIGTLVDGNVIEGRKDVQVGQRGAGIHLFDSKNNVIRNNQVSFVRDGVYFDHSDFNVVEDNHFSRLRYGVHYMYCKDNRFSRNVFRDSLGGVAVMYTENVTFHDNHILNNREGYNAFGLLLKDCLDSVAERNVIVNNVNGIFLDNSHRNRFNNNVIAYNDVGVMLYASSLQNRFARNDFIGNLATLHTVGRADADWTPDGKGNHFSDYAGYDLDGDGTGDIAHRLQDAFEYLVGSRPLLRLFLNSATADALAAAERSFPIVPSSDEIDTAPSMRPVSGVKLTHDRLKPDSTKPFPWWPFGSSLALILSGWLTWRLRQ